MAEVDVGDFKESKPTPTLSELFDGTRVSCINGSSQLEQDADSISSKTNVPGYPCSTDSLQA